MSKLREARTGDGAKHSPKPVNRNTDCGRFLRCDGHLVSMRADEHATGATALRKSQNGKAPSGACVWMGKACSRTPAFRCMRGRRVGRPGHGACFLERQHEAWWEADGRVSERDISVVSRCSRRTEVARGVGPMRVRCILPFCSLSFDAIRAGNVPGA